MSHESLSNRPVWTPVFLSPVFPDLQGTLPVFSAHGPYSAMVTIITLCGTKAGEVPAI
jgi:hypothetical protein